MIKYLMRLLFVLTGVMYLFGFLAVAWASDMLMLHQRLESPKGMARFDDFICYHTPWIQNGVLAMTGLDWYLIVLPVFVLAVWAWVGHGRRRVVRSALTVTSAH
jgi:hypothetical protein